MRNEHTIEAIKLSPSFGISALSYIGSLSLQDWMYIVTITYTLTQLGYFIYKRIKREDKST